MPRSRLAEPAGRLDFAYSLNSLNFYSCVVILPVYVYSIMTEVTWPHIILLSFYNPRYYEAAPALPSTSTGSEI
ncbi:unnamed protein product [Amoebophrya sp. A25]|nr:unnamed protein product [Amoebophrya sp. A25]|eukprot:GSA25T00001996001.1